jgi:hypothetical protein
MARPYENRTIRFYVDEVAELERVAKSRGLTIHALVRDLALGVIDQEKVAA